jgi:molybdopterin converting factor small subunit
MPKITVKHFASLRELLNDTKEETYELKQGTSLIDLLVRHIPERHKNESSRWIESLFEMDNKEIKLNEDGAPILKYYLVLINGKLYQFVAQDGENPGFKYKLQNGDAIAILPPMGGG